MAMVGLPRFVKAEVFEHPLQSKVVPVELQRVTGVVFSRGRLLRSGDDVEAVFCRLAVAGCAFRLALAGVFYLLAEALTVYQAIWAAFGEIG